MLKKLFNTYLSLIFLASCLNSCSDHYGLEAQINPSYTSKDKTETGNRVIEETRQNVFVMFALGCNDLTIFINENLRSLEKGYLPEYHTEDDVMLIFSHSRNEAPVLFRMYRDEEGKAVKDTLITYPDDMKSADAKTINGVLTYVKDRFPAKKYGMLISSHGTGWAPERYCYSPPDISKSLVEEQLFGSGIKPLTKSIGNEWRFGNKNDMIEIEIQELADAIPMKLDYIIFDACFMGGIEVAYQLKDKCKRLCFSPAEILAFGMDYTTLMENLFKEEGADLVKCAQLYYNMYMNQNAAINQSATISVVDCSKLEPLVDIVKRNAGLIRDLAKDDNKDRDRVQRYFMISYKRYHGIFYDMRDILRMAGASKEDMDALDKALSDCIICKYNTPMLFNKVSLANCCGFSMYLPDFDRTILNPKYPETAWGKATGIIETENT